MAQDREESFELLFERYYPQVCRFFARKGMSAEDGKDLTQEVFFSVYEGLEGLREESFFERWLFKIAMNLFRNHLERKRAGKRAAVEVSLDSTANASDEGPLAQLASELGRGPAEVVLDKEKHQKVHQALESLPEQMRRCLQLRVVEDLTYQEIASIMGLSQNTVKVHLYQARKILRERLNPFFRAVDI